MVLSLGATILLIGLLFHLTKNKIPYIITLPSLLGVGIISLFAINIYKIMPMYYFVSMFFQGTVYGGKISMTIAEAGSANISASVMGLGPALYWVAWFGAIIFMARTLIHKKNHMIFMCLYFIMTLYFTMTAGRFLNDFVPFIAIFAGWSIYFLMTKIDYKQMFVNMKNIGGFKAYKGIKFLHVFGIVFIAFVVILPNVLLTFDAAIPWQDKDKYEGMPTGAYGISFGKEQYWTDAFSWLADQDTELLPEDRPAFISWWDYGFYEILIGKHPTVADNFQDGIETAANFKTARSEKEAVTVLIARLVHGNYNPTKQISTDVENILIKYIGENNTKQIGTLLDNIQTEAFNSTELVCKEYEPDIPSFKNSYNNYYHNFNTFTKNLTDEEVTEFYMDIQDATGWNIRYYGTEQYDMSIFSVFTFLADKSLGPLGGLEDEYYAGYFMATHRTTYEEEKIDRETMNNLTYYDRENYIINGPYFERKPAFYETMFYKTFYGTPINDGTMPENRLPTYGLKHFLPVYVSPYVTIAKYYEGCKINGTVICQGLPLPGVTVIIFDEYGIPHDLVMTEDKYNIVAPAGNLHIGFYIGNNEMDIIPINVTEEEGTRRAENYNKTVNVELLSVSLNGTLYKNETVVPNENITLYGQTTGMFIRVKTDENGRYEFNDIPPSYYALQTNNVSRELIVYENTTFNLEEV